MAKNSATVCYNLFYNKKYHRVGYVFRNRFYSDNEKLYKLSLRKIAEELHISREKIRLLSKKQ